MSAAYLDASALVKLFKPERESAALLAELERRPVWMASELIEVEARCTAYRLGSSASEQRVDGLLKDLDLVPLTPTIRLRAGEPFARPLRALDAIHLATALEIGTTLDVLVAYDDNLVEAATAAGLECLSPA